MVRFHPLPFYFIVPGNSINGQCSKSLIGSQRVVEILMKWPAGTSFNLKYQFFLLGQTPSSLTALPVAGEMTVNEIIPGIYAGDADSDSLPFQYSITRDAPFMAMFATNNQTPTLTAHAIAILEDA